MKIQLDTDQKIIKLEGSVKLSEFFNTIQNILPNDEWREYTVEANTIINWTNPIQIQPIWIDRNPWQTPYPTYPWITYGTGTSTMGQEYIGYTAQGTSQNALKTNDGVFNIEIK